MDCQIDGWIDGQMYIYKGIDGQLDLYIYIGVDIRQCVLEIKIYLWKVQRIDNDDVINGCQQYTAAPLH